MAVRNLMESIVYGVISEIVNNDDRAQEIRNCIDDVLSYVLNRIPPMYITSERGLLYAVIDNQSKVQQKIDILIIVYEAIEKVLGRRNSGIRLNKSDMGSTTARLPHLLGIVLEEENLSVIDGVEVSCLYGGSLAAMAYPEWKNPYVTSTAARGYYHFWLRYDPEKMGDKEIELDLVFKHASFEDKHTSFRVSVLRKEEPDITAAIPTALIKARKF
jgi:competence protein ComFB